MKVLVTGATGFVGMHVIKELLKTEHSIVATGIEEEKTLSALFRSERITYVRCDLNQENADYFRLLNQPDAIIHLAWEGLPRYGELFHFERNLPANYRFLKSLILSGLKDITAIGTCLEYGMQSGRLSEDMIPQPTTPYAIAKDSLRRFLEQLQKKKEFVFRWVRLFYTYGLGQNKNAILEQLNDAIARGDKTFPMSRGDQLRDYLPVEKIAEYIVRIALQKRVQGIINCCSGTPISIRELVEDRLRVLRAPISLQLGVYDYPAYEPKEFWGDTSKLLSIIAQP